MRIRDLGKYKQKEVDKLLSRVAFFKELQRQDHAQLDLLLRYSCIVELEPGETVMRRGDKGSWLYFLIRGSLNVYADEPQGEPLNHITPGELFGDLALLCNHKRKATVAAALGTQKVLLFATDFKPFGDIENFQQIDLATKLCFYRVMVHSIRWRLEVNKMQHPGNPLVQELKQIPVYSGEKGVLAELQSLFEQAQMLANLLDAWNNQGIAVQDVVVASSGA